MSNCWSLRSARSAYPWPSVLRLKAYVHVPFRRILLTRRNVLRRDGNRCQYCGSRERLTLDHVLPKSRGGPDTWDNLVAACGECNHRKGGRLPDEAGMRLRRRPAEPRCDPWSMYASYLADPRNEAWRGYLAARHD